MKSQSIKILGSVDFLGNPVGLLTDVASGVTGLIAAQPDVLGLVRDVTHGMSDTTSKVDTCSSANSVRPKLSIFLGAWAIEVGAFSESGVFSEL